MMVGYLIKHGNVSTRFYGRAVSTLVFSAFRANLWRRRTALENLRLFDKSAAEVDADRDSLVFERRVWKPIINSRERDLDAIEARLMQVAPSGFMPNKVLVFGSTCIPMIKVPPLVPKRMLLLLPSTAIRGASQ